jgi:hypothetical protein
MIAEALLIWASFCLTATRVYAIISREPNLTFDEMIFDLSAADLRLTFTRHLYLQNVSRSALVARMRYRH